MRIELTTAIFAPIERCFDLSRSIDLHVASTHGTGEIAIAGVTTGLIGLEETVTWKGRHFGLMLTHKSLITAFDRPRHFQDSMLQGAFHRYTHDHYFETRTSGTVMTDVMEFTAPFGLLGKLAEALVVERHLRAFLEQRNDSVKKVAESAQWKSYLSVGNQASPPAVP
jgi:ligand-binding SRPBCC domain-containing protein